MFSISVRDLDLPELLGSKSVTNVRRVERRKKCGVVKTVRSVSLITQQLPPISRSAPEKRHSTQSGLGHGYWYSILKGNNSRVLLSTLRRRPWWSTSNESHPECDMLWEMYRNPVRYKTKTFSSTLLNHVENNNSLVSKKGLYKSIRAYCSTENINILEIIPRTFYLKSGSLTADEEFNLFLQYNGMSNENDRKPMFCLTSDKRKQSRPQDNFIWILKPASKTNRGIGIKVVRGFEAVMNVIESTSSSTKEEKDPETQIKSTSSASTATTTINKRGIKEGWIVQEYMMNPLLISGRKFDLRCFVLIVLNKNDHDHDHGGLHAYFFENAYARTSSRRFQINDLNNREIHLTNDAIQKKSKAYGKFESGNKLDLIQLQEAISRDYPDAPRTVVIDTILPQIKHLTWVSIAAAAEMMMQTCIESSFELLGYDFMVDDQFRSTLIEINSNPCLEFACPLLTNIITDVIEHTFRVAVDAQFPPPAAGSRTRACEEAVQELTKDPLKFHCIYPNVE
eukprot:gene481-901_t